MTRLLVLSVSAGAGHVRAADAIVAAANSARPPLDATHIDVPTALGMRNLEKLGMRTVMNLRHFNHDDEEVEDTSLRTERVNILTWRIGDPHVIEVMSLLRETGNGPLLRYVRSVDAPRLRSAIDSTSTVTDNL